VGRGLRFDVGERALLEQRVAQIGPGFFVGVAQIVDQPDAVGVVVDAEPLFNRNASARPDLQGDGAGRIEKILLEIVLRRGKPHDVERAHATARWLRAASQAISRA
jgi:hypothetical protein